MKYTPRTRSAAPTKIRKEDVLPHTRVTSGFPPLPEPTRISRGDVEQETLARSGWVCGFCTHVRRIISRMFTRKEN